jgi:hypothetical protein
MQTAQRKPFRELFNTNAFKVRYFQLIKDLGYMQRGIGLKDQWAAIIAEDITKAYQTYLTLENGEPPMVDEQVAGDMHGFFQRACRQSSDFMMPEDFREICSTVRLWDDSAHSKVELEDFYKVCAKEELFDSQYFQANSIELDRLPDPHQISMQQFTNAFEFLSRKPMPVLYQEVLDSFYIISKEFGMSITGDRIQNLFQEDDADEYDLKH